MNTEDRGPDLDLLSQDGAGQAPQSVTTERDVEASLVTFLITFS